MGKIRDGFSSGAGNKKYTGNYDDIFNKSKVGEEMKDKKVCCLFVPGVGTSKGALKNASKMGKMIGLPFKIVKWQLDVEERVNEARDLHQTYGAYTAKKLRKTQYDVFYDATGYSDYKNNAMTRVMEDYNDLILNYDEVILIGFSWGSVIGYDFLNEYFPTKVNKFITLGSVIPLRHLLKFHQIPCVKWINFWEKSDGIGHKMIKPGIRDIKINTGIKGIWIFSHFSYLKSKKIAKRIIKEFGL